MDPDLHNVLIHSWALACSSHIVAYHLSEYNHISCSPPFAFSADVRRLGCKFGCSFLQRIRNRLLQRHRPPLGPGCLPGCLVELAPHRC